MLVDLAGGDVVVAGQGESQVPLIVSEIQVDFRPCKEKQISAETTRK